MKIGIITIHNAHNYGAVLQCFSLQEYLKSQGHEVEIINYCAPRVTKLYALSDEIGEVERVEAKKYLQPISFFSKKRLLKRTDLNLVSFRKARQYYCFEQFIKEQFHLTKECTTYTELKNLQLQYDAMIAGSDQIWNGKVAGGLTPAYFLAFGNPKATRIAYAASIGADEIEEKDKDYFRRYLRELDAISVREASGCEQIQKLTQKKVVEVLDPTFLVPRKVFKTLEQKRLGAQKYIYVHTAHVKRVDDLLNEVAEKVSQLLGLPIIHNRSDYKYTNQLDVFSGRPGEFLGMIDQAEFVITNSFHCTIFSIFFHKKFITVPHYTEPDRMENLLQNLGLSSQLVYNVNQISENIKSLTIDYDQVENKMAPMIEQSRQFLNSSLANGKQCDRKTYLETKDAFSCYGCGACEAVCSVHAIQMKADGAGFRYPVINEELCTHCNLCIKKCIYRKNEVMNHTTEYNMTANNSSEHQTKDNYPIVYAAYNKNPDEVKTSTSGAMFPAFCEEILKEHGEVVGVALNDKLEVEYQMQHEREKCRKFKGSKYVAANNEGILKQVKEALQEQKVVLFTGTPCQIAGLKSYLSKSYKNLYTIENICMGLGSPELFRQYKEYIQKVYESKLTSFDFRCQFRGQQVQYIKLEFESGATLLERSRNNEFQSRFGKMQIQRPSCYQCEFVVGDGEGQGQGVADITVGDYWGISKQYPDFVRPQGVSILKINTEHGKQLFDQVSDCFNLKKSTLSKAYQENHKEPMVFTVTASKFLYEMREGVKQYE